MSSLIQQFSGRKRCSDVLKHFSYDDKQDKSRRLIAECNMLVATKNVTNLKKSHAKAPQRSL